MISVLDSCTLCASRRIKRERTPLHDTPTPEFAFEVIGIDTCGPFPETSSGSRYVITIIDHFTSWPEAFCVSDKSAQTVARNLLTENIPRHSCPKYILSDNGTEFVNAVISYLTEKMRISHVKILPYRPQSNARTERMHRFMNDVLAKYVVNDPTSWDQYVPAMLMAYRTSVQSSNRYSPFFLLYFRDPILPV